MYQVIRKLTRPDLTVEFPDLPATMDPAHKVHFGENYVVTEKHIFRQAEVDMTGLIKTTTVLWTSKEAWDEFSADPVMQAMLASNSALFASLGIVEETVSATEI
jgi:hypothetical protein